MIHLEKLGPHNVVRFDHGKVSALDEELLTALADQLEEVDRMPYGAVILTGTGSSFSAGVDLWRLLDGGAEYIRSFLPALDRALSTLFTLPRPVVAAVNGHAIAGGCVLACACDYRLMAEGPGRIGVAELRVGVPFPALALETLRFATGDVRAQEMVYLAEVYSAQEARELNLVDEVVPPGQLLERAGSMADRLAAIPEASFKISKLQLRQPALDRVARLADLHKGEIDRIWSDDEIQASIRSFMETAVGKSGG